MKVDELLKRLENIKIDEDEKCEIVEYFVLAIIYLWVQFI